MAGWLAGWLDGWMAGCQARCLPGQPGRDVARTLLSKSCFLMVILEKPASMFVARLVTCFKKR